MSTQDTFGRDVARGFGADVAARVRKGTDYDVRIGGTDYDRGVVLAFLKSGRVVSAEEAKNVITPELADGGKITQKELQTLVYCLQHSKVTAKATRKAFLPALEKAFPDNAIGQLANGHAGFQFDALTQRLERKGRLPDLYAAKTVMGPTELVGMWNKGLSIERFHEKLKQGLAPRTEGQHDKKFGADVIGEVKGFLRATNKADKLASLEGGKLSYGEVQNLIYGQWEHADPTLKGRTPYNARWDGKFDATV